MARTTEILNKEVDVVQQELGGVGRYHVLQAFFQLFISFVNACHYIDVVFIGCQPDYQCRTVENTTSLTERLAQRNITGSVVTTHYEKCSIIITVMDTMGNTSHSLPCVNGIQFSMPEHTSFLTEWSLVCDRRGLSELSQTVLMVGMAFGSLFFTSLSDRFGRKKVYISCAVGLLGSTVGYSLAPNYLVFLAFKVLTGALLLGSRLAAYTMLIELMPKQWRSACSAVYGVTWALGCVFLPGMAYCMQDLSWRYLSLALSSLYLYSLLLPCFLDESIRWLIATDKWDEANRILHKAKRMNGRHTLPTARNTTEAETDNLVGSTRDMELLNVIEPKEDMAVKNSEEMTGRFCKHDTAEKTTCTQVTTVAKISLITSSNAVSEGEDKNSGQLVMNQESLSVNPDNSRKDTVTSHLIDLSDDVTGESTNRVDHTDDTRSEEHFKGKESLDKENKDGADSDLPDKGIQIVQLSRADSTRYKVWDLCRHREVLVPLIVSCFIWTSNNLYYYSAVLGSSTWAGNRFLNLAILTSLEIPAYLMPFFVMLRVNRRPLCAAFGIVSSLSMLLSVCCTFLVKTDAGFTAARVLGFIGQFAVNGSYCVILVFIPEVFPTCLRTAGMGTASASARLSGMLAPFVVLLGQSLPWAPGVLTGSLTFMATLSLFILPETRNRKLPDTITAIRAWRAKL